MHGCPPRALLTILDWTRSGSVGVLFNSFEYALFLPTVLILYWRLPRRFQNPLLLVASYVFYGSWDWRFLGLLLQHP